MADILSCGLLGVMLSSTSSWSQSGQVSLPRPDAGVGPGPSERYMYPQTRCVNASSIYHSKEQGSVVVDDPYRWLEKDSPERRVWAEAQDRFSTSHLQLYSGLGALRTAVQRSYNYTKFEAPYLAHDLRWYWMARSCTQKQPAVYRSVSAELPNAGADGSQDLEAISELFFDTNALSNDGSKSLSNWLLSPDKELAAFSIGKFGSDTEEILIYRSSNLGGGRNVIGNQLDSIKETGFGAFAWAPDSKGVYYTKTVCLKRGDPTTHTASDEESDRPKILWHRVGTPQDDDKVLLVGEQGSLFFISASFDGCYSLLSISKDTTGANQLWIAENKMSAHNPSLEWIIVKATYEGSLTYIGNDGPLFHFMTNAHSDRNYVVKWTFQTGQNSPLVPVEHMPDSRDIFLRQYAPISADYAVAVYSHNVNDELYLLPKDGPARRLDSHFVGTITVNPTKTGFLATFVSYNAPGLVKRLDWPHPSTEPSWELWRDSKFEAFLLSSFVVEQLWYPSKDGTNIFMFVLYKKTTKLDGTAPYLQYGYGSNSMSLLPFFCPLFLTFADTFGGVVGIPNIRGGSEFGSRWSDAGSRAYTVNSVDDFISATEYLVGKKYISPIKTIILGWSGGAELVMKSIYRAPARTFGCAIADRGAYDSLRFPLFTPGLYWIGAIGDPFNPQDFDFLYPFSPLHNVSSSKCLPATLVVIGGEDIRIDALHAYKLATTCQHNAAVGSGIQLLKIIPGAGHETGKSTDILIEEDVVKLGFLAKSLGLSANCNPMIRK